MQHRMKTHPLAQEKIDKLLSTIAVGSLATVNADGTPYVTPVHFVYTENNLYIHGLPKGQKIANITHNSNVSFSVYDMHQYLLDPENKPCDTNTEYESVIITGNAVLLKDLEIKKMILQEFVAKYTPHLSNQTIPEAMIKSTAVIKIAATKLTGKYYN